MSEKPIDPFSEFARFIEAHAREIDRIMMGPPIAMIDGKPVKGLVNFRFTKDHSGRIVPTSEPIDANELEVEMFSTVGIDLKGEVDDE